MIKFVALTVLEVIAWSRVAVFTFAVKVTSPLGQEDSGWLARRNGMDIFFDNFQVN